MRDATTGVWVICCLAWACISAAPCVAQAPDQDPTAQLRLRAVQPGPFPPAKRPWGPEQATGAPDTEQAGDMPTAWASLNPDDGVEWLRVDFDQAVTISEVRIRETFNPGAVSKVVAVLQDGKERVLWEGRDPTAEAPADFVVKAQGDVVGKSMKVYLDSNRVEGWNEIDAVELVGKDGKRQWASHASASSTYADRTGQPGAFGRTGYRTDVKISPSGIPHQYVVEFKISQTLQNGTSNLSNSPRMIVTAGQEGEVKAMDLQERDGILCKALIEEKVDSVEALTSVTVKMQGIETLSSTQHMTVTK